MPVKVTTQNKSRLDAIANVLRRLPPLERQLWAQRINAKLRGKPARESREFGTVSVSGEFGTVAPQQPQPKAESEWDLELANWLDGVYTTVATRAEEVHKKALEKVQETGEAVGASLMPVVLLAAVAMLAYGFAKR